jgi:hypothetical protein
VCEMSSEPVVPTRLPSLELPVEEQSSICRL